MESSYTGLRLARLFPKGLNEPHRGLGSLHHISVIVGYVWQYGIWPQVYGPLGPSGKDRVSSQGAAKRRMPAKSIWWSSRFCEEGRHVQDVSVGLVLRYRWGADFDVRKLPHEQKADS